MTLSEDGQMSDTKQRVWSDCLCLRWARRAVARESPWPMEIYNPFQAMTLRPAAAKITLTANTKQPTFPLSQIENVGFYRSGSQSRHRCPKEMMFPTLAQLQRASPAQVACASPSALGERCGISAHRAVEIRQQYSLRQ